MAEPFDIDAFNEQWNRFIQSAYGQMALKERQQAQQTEQNRYGDTQRYQSAQLKNQKAQLDQQYKIAKMNARNAAESNAIDRWYKEQSIGMAKTQLLAGLKGPSNALQYERVASGMGLRDPNAVPASVTAAFNNERLPQTNAFSGTPIPAQSGELAQMVNTLGGSGGGQATGVTPDVGADTYANTMAKIKEVAARGPHKMAPGVYESMTDYQKQIFDSGLSEAGYDPGDWHQRRIRAAPGQGDPRSAL